MSKGFESNVWVLLERAADVPGEWIAHCLDLDVVMQGPSLRAAFAALLESMAMVVADDLKASRDPLDRRAPKSEWDRLWAAVKRGEKRPAEEPLPADDTRVEFIAGQVLFGIRVDKKVARSRSKKRKVADEQMPLALAGYSVVRAARGRRRTDAAQQSVRV